MLRSALKVNGEYMKPGWTFVFLVLLLAGCGRENEAPVAAVDGPVQTVADSSAPDEAAGGDAAPVLEDVSEYDPRYLVGISYPPEAARHPGLARELLRHAAAAREELDRAVAGLGEDRPAAPYDLVLEYHMIVDSPQVVAVAVDGGMYTGGAHGQPLVDRFVWLPQQERLLLADDLIDDADGWKAISSHVREQLYAQLSQQLDAQDAEPGERAEQMRTLGRMIDEGTAPRAAEFERFEPVLGPDNRIQALRFVFPPYQVGPYSDGTHVVEVPAAVLLPHVAGPYRELFSTG